MLKQKKVINIGIFKSDGFCLCQEHTGFGLPCCSCQRIVELSRGGRDKVQYS